MSRPLTESGVAEFGRWVLCQTWNEVYSCDTVDKKVETFNAMLMNQFHISFPYKSFKVSGDDMPWFTKELKHLNRRNKREYFNHQKSEKWKRMNMEKK